VTPAQLKDLFARKAGAIARRPRFARASDLARVRLGPDLVCTVEHPGHVLTADAPPENGGGGAGPDPSELMSASLGASLAMGYRLWGARLDVPIAGAEVEIVCEYDLRGQLGADQVPIHWQRLLMTSTIVSPADEAEVRRVADAAHRWSPMLANLSPEIERVVNVRIARGNDPFPRG
jgi:uncharacterized OsmC-like protein